jgi:hypothetical protein
MEENRPQVEIRTPTSVEEETQTSVEGGTQTSLRDRSTYHRYRGEYVSQLKGPKREIFVTGGGMHSPKV